MKADMAEWEFVQNLSYRKHLSEEEATFVKLMYTTKLKKVSREEQLFLGRNKSSRGRTHMSARSSEPERG